MSQLFSSLKISGSGLSVFRRKMNITAENIANAQTTKTADGGPYKRKSLQITAKTVDANFAGELDTAKIKLTSTHQSHYPGKRIARYGGTNVFHAQSEEIVDPNQNVRMVYDPSHPDADADGFVAMPDVDPLIEMVEMMTASRAYEANLSAIKAIQNMSAKAMDI